MDLGLDGHVAIVAGSSRGIGRGIAAALLAEGARVVVTGRDKATLRATCDALSADGAGDRVLEVVGDLGASPAIAETLERTLSTFGRLDHVVANIGDGAGSTGWDVADGEWQELLERNLLASVRLARAALPTLIARKGSSLLFVSSIAGVEATRAPLAYGAAKAALVSYGKNLARQLGPDGVRVNTIAPGNILFDGGAWDRHRARDRSSVDAMLQAEVPQRRFGSVDEIAAFAAFLCSTRAGFATGGCYVVDGGQTRSL